MSLAVGTTVHDRDDDDESKMLIVALTSATADQYHLEGTPKTIADVNENYPADDLVVEVVYLHDQVTDISHEKRYAFPASRLRPADSTADGDKSETEAEC